MKTKEELLSLMKRYVACDDAFDYVARHPSDDAAIIGADCIEQDWLIWFLSREKRLHRFVDVCAKRCKKFQSETNKHHASQILLKTESYHDETASHFWRWNAASDCAWRAIRCAATASEYGSWDYKASMEELKAQAKGLKRIWQDWCDDKPEEKALKK